MSIWKSLTGFVLPAVMLALFSSCAGGETGVDAVETIILRSGDGAEAAIDFNNVEGKFTGSLELVAAADGTVSDDHKNVSATYALSASGPLIGDIVVSIPVERDLLPELFAPAAFRPEMQDPLSGLWRPIGSLTEYDESAAVVSFVVPQAVVDSFSVAGVSRKLRAGSLISFESLKYRIGIAQWTESVTTRIPGSQFTITYYPPALAKSYSVKADAVWASTSGRATDPTVPDFIEDLDAALNDAYTKLLALNYGSTPLFAPLTDAQRNVYVGICGESAGDSPIGGPMRISNTQVSSFEDMRGVAGHELVHVFQGQYFLTGKTGGLAHLVVGAGSWLWFIEGSANYFSAHAQVLAPASKDVLYGRNEDALYLSQGLASHDSRSYYMAAHFMDFIAERAGEDVIPAVLKSGSSVKSLSALSKALLASPRGDGLGATFEEYGRRLVRYPETGSAMHLHLVANLLNFNTDAERAHLTGISFSDTVTFIKLNRLLPPLGMSYAEARISAQVDAMLVIEALPANPASVSTFTWDRVGSKDADFVDSLPLEDYSGKTLTVKGFGKDAARSGFSQIVINNDFTRYHQIDFAYYILVPPEVISVVEGAATVDISSLGNIPSEYVAELRLMRLEDSGVYVKVATFKPGEDVLVTVSKTAINIDDDLEIQIVDRHGNAWPEFDMGEPRELFIGCRTVDDDGVDGWGCESIQWVGDDLESEDFINAARMKCLNEGYRQYYAVAFEQEKQCRDWCSGRASSSGTCATPGSPVDPVPQCQNVPVGSDVCIDDACYNCCDGCDDGLVFLFACADGCYTSASEINNQTVSLCDCN